MAASGREISQELRQAVQRSQWEQVVRLVHSSDCSYQQRHWAITHTVQHAPVWFVRDRIDVILDCTGDQLDIVLSHLLTRRLWRCVGHVLQRDISHAQRSGALEEVLKHVGDDYDDDEEEDYNGDDDIVKFILPHCSSEELEHIITTLVSRGLWEPVAEVLGLGVSTEQHRWAVEQASRQANDYDFAVYILPQCNNEELGHVIVHLVSRGLWVSVGELLGRGVSTEQHRWVVEQASRHADDDGFVQYILPQCGDEELEHNLDHFVSRGLWNLVREVENRRIGASQHVWPVEQAAKHADDDRFVQYILPQCHDEELEHNLYHFVSRGLWNLVDKVLKRGVGASQHVWAVEQATKHADEDSFNKYILSHCYGNDVVDVFPLLVASRQLGRTRDVLCNMVTVTLHKWMTSGRGKRAHYTLFWKFIHHCRVDVSLALDLTKAVKGEISNRRLRYTIKTKTKLGDRAKQFSWQRALRESLEISLLHTLCYMMSSDDRQYTDSTEHTKQCVSDIYTHITACIADNTDSIQDNTLKTIENKQKWTSVFTEIADTHKTDPLFLLHFLQGLNLYHVSRRGENDDAILLVMLAVFPLFPQLQSVALRMMLREERWDVISQACLSHVWEHDRRQLFKAVVLQRQWSVVRQWSDHTVHDDEREWAMTETLKEALKEKAFKEVSLEAFKEKVFKEGFRVAFKKAFKENAFKQAFREALKVKALKISKEAFNEKVFKEGFKEAFREAFKDSFKEKTFKEAFKGKVFNAKVFKEKAIKEEAFKEAFKESFKGKAFKEAFKEETFKEAFKEETFKEAFKEETFKDYFKDEAFKEAFKEKAFEGEALKEVFKETFKEEAFKEEFREAFKEVFISFKKEAFISFKVAFKQAFKEEAFIILRETIKETVKEEDFKDTFTEKWMVYLLLADHGLTPPEQMHAHYMVAKYGNWGTVKQMVERGGDLTEVGNLLENWVTGNLRKKPQGDVTVYMERCEKLIRTRLGFAKDAALSPMKALERWRWGSVLYSILHKPTDEYFSLVIDKLIEEEEWHILMHLVRLGMNKAERNWLFPEMVRQQQWGVCRMLLEYGVDDQLCVEALPELMERNQWTLVARVMEYNVDDAVRRQVMQCAFHRRAGALFWHCLNVMEDKQPLTKETRVKLFYQAISRDIWQAVKPLVEEKDGPGIQRRDMAFLEAIEQHLWDVVDHCQLHGADINMKDENGETPLHREARKQEWIAVKEIVLRDGKPNLLDKDGVSVLNRLIHHEQWGIVKIVIMYGGDIHLSARFSKYNRKTHTPLQALIDSRQANIIQFSIMWCGDQKKGVNDRGETCFHAVCDSDYRWDVMEDLIVRKVDPLAVTKTGKSPLVYAVLNGECPGRMVAECCRLGFSSHQPSVNGPQESLLDDINRTVVGMWELDPVNRFSSLKYFDRHYMQRDGVITSPLVYAVLRDSPVLVHMLYESASCSRTEVITLYTQLPRLTDVNTEEGRRLHEEVLRLFKDSKRWFTNHALQHLRSSRRIRLQQWNSNYFLERYGRLTHSIEKHTALLRELDTTPRTLRSSCRLLILQHFHFSDTKRHQLLGELPLPTPLKNYLEFSDLCDPDYGKHNGLPSEDTQDD